MAATQLQFQLGLDTSQIPAQAAAAGAAAGKQLKSTFEQNVANLKMPQLKFEVDAKGNKLELVGQALKDTEVQAKKTAATLNGKLGGAVKNVQGFFSKLGNVLKGQIGQFALVQTAANLLTASLMKIVQGIGAFVKQAAEMEVLMLQLEAFVGSADGAAEAYQEFKTLAEKTPFNVKEIADAGRILLGFGVDADTAVESTKRLAVVASAVGGDMNNLARNLGQISAQQRAYTRDLTQFAIQGIPIWSELSNATGRSVAELKKLATEGKIGMDEVTVALANMTAKGTDFEQISAQMGTTLVGRMQKLGSTITDAARNFGEMLQALDESTGLISAFVGIFQGGLDLINNGIQFATKNMRAFGTVVSSVAALLATFFIATQWAGFVTILGQVAKAMGLLRLRTVAAGVAQAFLNALMGPAGWASIAVAIGVAAGVALAFNVQMDDTIAKNKILKEQKEGEAKAAEKRLQREKNLAKTQDGLNTLIAEGTKKINEFKEAEKKNDGLTKEQVKDYNDIVAKVNVWKKSYEELYGVAGQVTAQIKKAKAAEAEAVEASKKRVEAIRDEKQIKDRAREDTVEALDDEKKAFDKIHSKKMEALEEQTEAVNDNADAAIEAQEMVHEKAMDDIEAEKKELDTKKASIEKAYDAESDKIDGLREDEESRHENRLGIIEREVEALDSSLDQQKAMTEQLKTAEKARHDGAMDGFKKQMEAAKASYDFQIDALDKIKQRNLDQLNALTPAEKELRDIRIAGLQATVKDGSKPRKERLEAQAALDDMKRQETISKVLTKDKKERERLGQNLENTQEGIASQMEREKDAHETNISRIEAEDRAKTTMIENEKLAFEEKQVREKTAHEGVLANIETQQDKEEAKKDAALQNITDEEEALNKRSDDEKTRHEDTMERINTERDRQLEVIGEEVDALTAIKTARDTQHTDRMEAISDEKRETDRMYADILEDISDQRTAEKEAHDDHMIELKERHDTAMDNYAKQEAAAKKVAAAAVPEDREGRANFRVQAPASGKFVSGRNRASGGPVSGGTSYTVNELGKEAFLSASGKLSMIKAPAWGQWKAPGKGTVIPAHLTSQMSIPSGGVNIDGGAHANGMKAAQGGGINRLVSAIRNSANGGNYNNQVTIQSTNPNQTASDMLVSLNRIKRRRYS